MPDSPEAIAGPEIVVGIIRPVGTSQEEFRMALKGALLPYGYTAVDIKLSDLLKDEATRRGVEVPEQREEARIAALMDEGDKLCRRHGTGSAVALLGVAEIRHHRMTFHSGGAIPEVEAADIPVARTAYVLDSLKRPAELTHLRRIYGDHFIAVSLQASLKTRRAALDAKMRPQSATRQQAQRNESITEIIGRDLREADEFGQNILRAFPMADVFIDLESDVSAQTISVVDLLFDSPKSRAPTHAEFSMMLADVTSTRSPELGLKVGAALINAEGDVIGLGHNAHPEPDQVPEFDASTADLVELVADTVGRLGDDVLTQRARDGFAADPDAFAEGLLAGPLANSRLRDLIEFQRPVHAEMRALLAALRSRAKTAGASMFVTAYPCHHCARHLIALGLTVTYLEPYPKSRAEAMYGAAVDAKFHPYTGIAPRRYVQLFAVTGDRKDAKGIRRAWGDPEKAVALPKLDPFVVASGIADREVSALEVLADPSNADPADADPADENLSQPRVTLTKAGTGKAPSDKPATRRRSSAPSSPTSPARKSKPKGGRT